jgi:hypothetical protein
MWGSPYLPYPRISLVHKFTYPRPVEVLRHVHVLVRVRVLVLVH